MGTLSELPGVAAQEVEAPTVRTLGGFVGALRAYRAAISAGEHGACTVWRDDAGDYRCEFSRHMVTHDSRRFTNFMAVKSWLREWMPKQHVACVRCKGEKFLGGKEGYDGSYTTSRPCPDCNR